jgi:hypothetical protein
MDREPKVKLQRKKRQEQGSGGWVGAAPLTIGVWGVGKRPRRAAP